MSPAPREWLRSAGWTGVYQSPDGHTPGDKLWFAENWFPVGGVLVARRGINDGSGGALQIGTTGVAQLAHDFIKSNGTVIKLYVVNGELYDHTTRVITSAQLTAALITLSTTSKCYAVTFTDQVAISDGANTPFLWDGTTGGGLTKLTNCPVLYGQPTVHYAKLFGIKNANPRAIVWSEENDATTGYEAGFNNIWTLSQSNERRLYMIHGTNVGLYYWRENSIGRITGAVTTDFVTTGTHDDVSTEVGTGPVGTLAPRVVQVHGTLFFFGPAADISTVHVAPWALRGTELIPLWHQLRPVISEVRGKTKLPYRANEGELSGLSLGGSRLPFYWTKYDAVVFVTMEGATPPGNLLGIVFDAHQLGLLGYLTVAKATGAGSEIDLVGIRQESTSTILLAKNRYVGLLRPLVLGDVSANFPGSVDNFGGTGANPTVRAVLGKLTQDERVDQHFATIAVEADRDDSDVTSLGVQYLTSEVSVVGSMAAAQTVSPTVERVERKAVGTNGYGRWIAPVVSVNFSSSSADYAGVRLHAVGVESLVDALEPSTV